MDALKIIFQMLKDQNQSTYISDNHENQCITTMINFNVLVCVLFVLLVYKIH